MSASRRSVVRTIALLAVTSLVLLPPVTARVPSAGTPSGARIGATSHLVGPAPAEAGPPASAKPPLLAGPPSLGPGRPRILPYSWAGRPVPPGGEALAELADVGGAGARSLPSDGWGDPWGELASHCYGVWPSDGGQGQYLPGCYGHDEPGIDGYSTLNGSGGNVTWALQLPRSANATPGSASGLQADLYTAIWFGLPLYDPYAWMDLCFLELQFYPDSSWTQSGPASDTWVGAAVGWQIQATTYAEDPCFYQVLDTNGVPDEYFDMSGGDQVLVVMQGSARSATGEQLQVIDQTKGTTAPVTLFNSSADLPLDPAYGRSEMPNALEWTPGGQLPVSFAFETGHTIAPFPNNNSYGGCSAGWPPSDARDPATPCPSYDPGSWINDTAAPWEISPPTFFNATASETATQVAFTQDLGGISFIDGVSNGACDGRDGSAWCSYPWYSYSCATHAFSFGASDWPGTSDDFGRFGEFQPATVRDGADLSFYPPTNVSVPTCGGPNATVSVSAGAGGSTYFLNGTYGAATPIGGLGLGAYSLGAIAGPGDTFDRWTTSGAVSVGNASDPTTSLSVGGNGSVSASFLPIGQVANVSWGFSTVGGGAVQVAQGFAAPSVPAATSVSGGELLEFPPGIYSINALPPPGENFSFWTIVSAHGTVAAPRLPFTWLDATGSGEVVAHFTVTPSRAWIYVAVTGFGHVTFNGTNFSQRTGAAYFPVPVGSYAVSFHPDAGSALYAYAIAYTVVSLDYSGNATIVCENGTVAIIAYFSLAATVVLNTSSGSGAIALGNATFDPSGTPVALDFYPNASAREPIAARAPAGDRFAGWTVSSGIDLWVANRGAAITSVLVNGSGNLTARFVPAGAVGLGFSVSPAGSGTFALDGVGAYANGSSDSALVDGLYFVSFTPALGFALATLALSGAGKLLAGSSVGWPGGGPVANVTGAGAVLSAGTSSLLAPVTFDAFLAGGGANASLGRLTVDGTSVPNGGTASLSYGSHLLGWTPAGSDPLGLVEWSAAGSLAIAHPNGTQARLFVNGSGAVTLALAPAFTVNVTVALVASSGGFPVDARFHAEVGRALASPTFHWFSPGGPPGPNASQNLSGPGVYRWTLTVDGPSGENYAPESIEGVIALPATVPAAAVSVGPVDLEAPVNATVRVAVTGGAAPYAISVSVPTAGFTGAGPNETWRIAFPGTYDVDALVRDSEGLVASANTTVRVARPLAIENLSASVTAGYAPLWVNFTAESTGGLLVPPITWYVSGVGAPFARGPIASYVFLAAGNYTVSAQVTDGAQVTVERAVTIFVHPVPAPITAGLTATPSQFVLGNGTSLAFHPTGGAPPYSYWWNPSTLPDGCLAARVASLGCTPGTAGTFHVTAFVNDSVGRGQSTEANVTFTVQPVPHVSRTHSRPASGLTTLDGVGLAVAAAVAAGLAAMGYARSRRRAEARPPAESEEYDLDIPSDPSTDGPTEWP